MRTWPWDYVGMAFGDAPGQVTCWQLVRMALAEQAGIVLPAYGEIAASDLRSVMRTMGAAATARPWLPVSGKPRAFDVVLMTGASSQRVGHVGVCTDGRSLLHVQEKTRSVIVPQTHFTVRDRILGYRRHEALA